MSEENNTKLSGFISNHWSFILGVLTLAFTSGGIYSEFRLMRHEIEESEKEHKYQIQQIIEERERKNNWLQEQEERIDELEEWRSWEDGKHDREKY